MTADNNLNNKSVKIKRIMVISIILIVLAVSCYIAWRLRGPMAKFVSEPQLFRDWIDERGIWGMVAYVAMLIVQVILAIIPGEPLEIAGGYAFGSLWGTVLCVIGTTIGSIIVYLLVKRFGMKMVTLFFSKEKIDSLKFLKSSPKRNILFMIIFIIPGTPKDLLCYFIGLTDINFMNMLLICSLGRLPSVITSTVGGNALGTENYIWAVVVFVATAVISIGGIAVYNWICKKNEAKKAEITHEQQC